MRWIIDSDVLIEGEKANPAFLPWLQAQQEVATADIIRAEFLIGVHTVGEAAKRVRGENFYRNHIVKLASFANEAGDFEVAGRLAGEARRTGKGKPSLADCLVAAIAIRTGATVATRNLNDFQAMGCPCKNPF